MSRSLTGLLASTLPKPASGSPSGLPVSPQESKALPSSVSDPLTKRTLVIGRGISIQGTVMNAERLVVEGTFEASMVQATELVIAPGGIFKGAAQVRDVQVAGTFDGTLTGLGDLVVYETGKVFGIVQCKHLQVENGGEITGRLDMAVSLSAEWDVHVAGEATNVEDGEPMKHHAHNSPSAKLDSAPNSTDADNAALVRKKLGIDGLNVIIPPEFDDETFSRQVLGLPD